MHLVQAIPLIQTSIYMGPPRYAVFADEEGNPYFEPLIALGMCAFNPERPDARTMVGMTMADHIEAADVKANFVGWQCAEIPADGSLLLREWADKARAKRNALTAAEAEKKKAKIIIPNERGIVEAIQVK